MLSGPDYVIRKYGKATVVFDGYSVKPSTNEATHKRRKGATSTYSVKFEHTMICKLKKDDFLSNEENKFRFINLLSQKL